jgi:hypothetical protein
MRPCYELQLPISTDYQLRTIIDNINITSPAIALNSTIYRQTLLIDANANADVVRWAKTYAGEHVD